MSDELKNNALTTAYSYHDEEKRLIYVVLTEPCSNSSKERIVSVSINHEDGDHMTKTINEFNDLDKFAIEVIHNVYSHLSKEKLDLFLSTLDMGIISNLSARTFSYYMGVEHKRKLTIYVDYFGSIIMIKESYINEDGIWDMTRNAPGSMFFESLLEEFSTRTMRLNNKLYCEFIDLLNDETRSEYFELKWIPKKH